MKLNIDTFDTNLYQQQKIQSTSSIDPSNVPSIHHLHHMSTPITRLSIPLPHAHTERCPLMDENVQCRLRTLGLMQIDGSRLCMNSVNTYCFPSRAAIVSAVRSDAPSSLLPRNSHCCAQWCTFLSPAPQQSVLGAVTHLPLSCPATVSAMRSDAPSSLLLRNSQCCAQWCTFLPPAPQQSLLCAVVHLPLSCPTTVTAVHSDAPSSLLP